MVVVGADDVCWREFLEFSSIPACILYGVDISLKFSFRDEKIS